MNLVMPLRKLVQTFPKIRTLTFCAFATLAYTNIANAGLIYCKAEETSGFGDVPMIGQPGYFHVQLIIEKDGEFFTHIDPNRNTGKRMQVQPNGYYLYEDTWKNRDFFHFLYRPMDETFVASVVGEHENRVVRGRCNAY